MPGAGRWAPKRYSSNIAAVNRIFVRISPTLNAPRIVEITGAASALDQLAGAARRLDLLASRLTEGVSVNGQRLGNLALGQDLDRDALARGQALGLERFEGHGVAGIEPGLEVAQVDRLGVGPEGLEWHRLLHVRTTQLAHPHVDRHLAALEARPLLGARARAVALLASAGGLPGARTLTAPDPLAWPARARGRPAVVQAGGLAG